ncbi:cadherin repeat domain-containing protein [Vibrio olivae]
MNSANISQIMLATIIIDVNGQIRTLAAGEQPRPGEVVVDLGEDLTNGNNIDVQLVESSGENVDITLDNEIAQLLEQIEAGEDPTQNPDLATAAGGQNGSSPTASGAIERTGAETLAATSFDTTGLESQGLSETQSLALLDLIGETLIISSGDAVINYFENSSVDTVLAIVNLAEFEGLEQSFSLQFEAGDPLADYFVINEAGEIRLTQAGVEAFTNDFETGPNSHVLTVTVTAVDGDGLVQEQTVNITLQELDVNEAPVFTLPPDDNGGDDDNNNGEADSESPGFVFEYSENSSTDDIIGQVAASDPDAGDSVTYSIIENVVNSDDEPLYEIDTETGEISLTQAGVDAFTNDFEDVEGKNNHQILVGASDGELTTEIIVNLNEKDVNESPTFVDENDETVNAYTFEYSENSSIDDIIGQVSALDPEGLAVEFQIVYQENDPLEGLFEIDSAGNISLTSEGVAAFTNDFEDQSLENMLSDNEHTITVVATDPDGNESQIVVQLNEKDVDEAPIFVDNNDETVNAYTFEYSENSSIDDIIGQVSAQDPEGLAVEFQIVYQENDPLEGLFEIDSAGNISLTPEGVAAFTNDFEDQSLENMLSANQHTIMVVATDPAGNQSQIVVQLNEKDVNEAPIAEDFSVDVDIEASTQIIFDSDNPDYDFISDVEDDISGEQVMVMLTSLPDYGTLYYTEGEVTREITSADLYSTDSPLATQFDPNFITYQIDESDKVTFVFGDSDGNSSTVGEWGEPTDATDTKRTFSLSNGNDVMFWITDQNGSPDEFELYENNNGNDGYGLADDDGNGITGNGGNGNNGHETFHIDLGGNPLETVHLVLMG